MGRNQEISFSPIGPPSGIYDRGGPVFFFLLLLLLLSLLFAICRVQ